ncbi:MAG: hypothetical protein K0Q50_209 [Vampirovibrio sp.]|jgi:hypothetical protein|nr:hypothetical protein [Vampirovibrio sp.]
MPDQLYWLIISVGTLIVVSSLICIACVVAAGRADKRSPYYYDDERYEWGEPF